MILINIPMPKNCGECIFNVNRWCIINSRFRHKLTQGCPLTEIPPHGDLIDRDALNDKIYHTSYCDPVVDWDDICAAPTIIEADGNSFQNGNYHSKGNDDG